MTEQELLERFNKENPDLAGSGILERIDIKESIKTFVAAGATPAEALDVLAETAREQLGTARPRNDQTFQLDRYLSGLEIEQEERKLVKR